jgi:hypothetical protein
MEMPYSTRTLMKRFSKGELSTIGNLVEKGASLREISSQVGRSKSAVQYHVAKARGKRPREKALLVEKLAQTELGWLIGFYAGDGSRYFRKDGYSYEVKFSSNEKEYPILEFVETLLCKCGLKTRRAIEGKRVYVRCQSKRFYKFVEKYLVWEGTLKSKSVRLVDLNSYSDDFLFSFLCGLIDADGGTKRLYISTASEQMANDIVKICGILGIDSKKYAYDVYHVYLRKTDFRRACEKYNFSSIKHKS